MGPISTRDRAAERLEAARKLAIRLGRPTRVGLIDEIKPARALEPIGADQFADAWASIDVAAPPVRIIRVSDIKRTVANYYGIPQIELVSDRRDRQVIRPRQIVMYLAREMTTLSLPAIGQSIGGRDHTTILYGYRKIHALVVAGDPISADVEEIRCALSEGREIPQRYTPVIPRLPGKWTEAEDDLVKAPGNAMRLSRKLGRSLRAVKSRRRYLARLERGMAT